MNSNLDQMYMTRVFALAEKGKVSISPNPVVGAILVKGGKVIGEGYHKKAGCAHAEIIALKNCKQSAKGAKLYINLEPCFHYGKTPPCVDVVIKSGIKEVIIATKDPNPLTFGKSIAKLRKNNIKVKVGTLQNEAAELNRHFFKFIKRGWPYIYLKAAITMDGKIAIRTSDSEWISCEKSRKWVHKKRKEVDAVLIGVDTAVKDNPRLTSRLKIASYPKRIVLDTNFKISPKQNIFKQPGETIIVTGNKSKSKANKFKNKNIKLVYCQNKTGQINLKDALRKLGKLGIASILVEGGGKIFTSFINEKLVDHFYFFLTPKIIGDSKAVSFISGRKINSIEQAIKLNFINLTTIDEDILIEAKYYDR